MTRLSADRLASIPAPGSMKHLAWVLVFLGALVAGLSWLAIAPLHRSGPECTGRIVIVPGPRGMPLECVCEDGRLATCFNPGS